MRAAIYTRISADPTGQGLGVERQLQDCERLCGAKGWTVAKLFSDNDISAYSGRKRPQYEAMLEAVAAGEVDVVVAYHSDRLHRSPAELERFIEIVEKAGVDVHAVSGGLVDLSTSAGRMVARILGSVARQESEHSAERRARANDQRAAAGVWLSSRRPFGYTIDGEPLEPEASAVRAAVEGVLSGKSVRQVAREWNEAGLRTTGTKTGGRLEWKSPSVRRILVNPRYAALRVHRGQVVGPGDWVPLIDVDQHHGVVAYLTDPARTGQVSFERRWQGSGVYRCGVCDAPAILHAASGGSRAYKCPKVHVRRQGPALDALVSAVVIAQLSKVGNQLLEESDTVDVVGLQTRRDGLRARLDSFGSMLGRGEMDAEQFKRATSEAKAQLDQVEGELARVRQSSPVTDLVLAGEAIAERWEVMSPDLRGKVIDALMTVRILPSPRGLRAFNPAYISIEWKSLSADAKEV